MKIPRIVLAGTSSGVGKTSITCAIIYALKKQGYTVQPFKVGPDYIDPSYLSSIAEQDTYNLDAWLMGEELLLKSFVRNSTDADISIIEGVMGYYDGFGGDTDYASTHHSACITKTPVILVMDASKSARSIAATAIGFTTFYKDSNNIAGVIVNNLGSKKHEHMCREALKGIGMPVIGCIQRDSALKMESRHLGLISTLDKQELHTKINNMAKTISGCLDIDKIIQIAHNAVVLPDIPPKQKNKKPLVRIGVALDASFNFYYQDNLEALRRSGATIEFFSPSTDVAPPPDCDGLYIGGGFPEILGERLAKNHHMQTSIKRMAQQGMPIYAECGGLMYLTKQIITTDGKRHNMVGIFDAETKMTKNMTLGYTKGQMDIKTPISTKQPPHTFHGHEFHYSQLTSISSDSKFAYTINIGQGIDNNRDGMLEYNTLASYGHLYFDGSDYARTFVEECIRYSKR